MKRKSKSKTDKNPPIDDRIREMAKDPLIMTDNITDLLARYHTDYYKLMVARKLFTKSVKKSDTKATASAITEYKIMKRRLMSLRRAHERYPKLFRRLLIDGETVRAAAPSYGVSFQMLAVLRQQALQHMELSGLTAGGLVKLLGSSTFEVPKFSLTSSSTALG